MKVLLRALQLLLATTLPNFFQSVRAVTSVPPVFTLDLALPPRKRWVGALDLIRASWAESWLQIFAEHNATLFSNLGDGDFVALGRALRTHFPESAAELEGISDEFLTVYGEVVTFEYLAGWVYYHELAHTDAVSEAAAVAGAPRECTGLLAQAAGGDTGPVHVANMDQSPEAVRNVTLHVRFVNSNAAAEEGAVLLEAVDWYWFTTGLSRVVKPGIASLQENWRTGPTPQPLRETLYGDILTRGTVPQILSFRTLLLPPLTATHSFSSAYRSGGGSSFEANSFEALVAALATVPLAAPFYVVMAGAARDEGVVMARNRTGVEGGILRIGDGNGDGENGGSAPWFLVQTNYDHWLPDEPSDPRRTVAEEAIAQFGRGVGATPLGLAMVASTYPVHNPHTAYTAIMASSAAAPSAPPPSHGRASLTSSTSVVVAPLADRQQPRHLLVPFVRDSMCPENPAQLPADDRYCNEEGKKRQQARWEKAAAVAAAADGG